VSFVLDVAALAKAWLATLGVMAGQGTLLVIIALVLTRAGRLRPSWQAAIWLVVALALGLPWRPALPWSLSDMLASLSDGSDAAVTAAPAAAHATAPVLTGTAIAWLLLAFAWAIGAAFVLVRALSAQRATVVAARRAVAAPPEALAIVHAHHSRVRLVVGDSAIGPHVVGLVRPIIVVPPALLDDPALLRAALLHELAHVRRRDAIGRYIQIAARTLMWWFPPVRLVNRRLDLAREAACDAWALEAGDVSRPAYARLLVRMAQLRAAAAPALAQHALDARVAAVLGPPARSRVGLVHRFVLVAWFFVALGGARTASARGHEPVCRYTIEMATALYAAYPEADIDGDGRLSREEACELQAELQNASRMSTVAGDTVSRPDPELATLLAEPLCCNCDEAEVYSTSELSSCPKVEGVAR
jgi:beta-lactamase regulating signal transducer with metallopeptidase domain